MSKFKNGDFIESLESGTVKAGCYGYVIDVFRDGNFWKYEIYWIGGGKTIAREKDLEFPPDTAKKPVFDAWASNMITK